MIRLDKEKLQNGTSEMERCGENLSAVKCESVYLTGNSEPMKEYLECFVKLQNVMNAYAQLLKNDSVKIQRAGEALIHEDRIVVKATAGPISLSSEDVMIVALER